MPRTIHTSNEPRITQWLQKVKLQSVFAHTDRRRSLSVNTPVHYKDRHQQHRIFAQLSAHKKEHPKKVIIIYLHYKSTQNHSRGVNLKDTKPLHCAHPKKPVPLEMYSLGT